MNKTLGDIVSGIIGIGVAASMYALIQIGFYTHSHNQLEKYEATNGIPQTVQAAQNTLETNISPVNYLLIPGRRLALVHYIQDHTNSQEN